MEKVFKLLTRIIMLPFVVAIFSLYAVLSTIRTVCYFAWYGGEFMVFEKKNTSTTVGELYRKLVEIAEEEANESK